MTTATTTHTTRAARRYPLPWAPTRPMPMVSPIVLHRPAARQLDLTVTSRFGVEAPTAIEQVRMQATRFTAAELQTTLQPLRDAAEAMATGRGTRTHWVSLCSALNVAMAIESGGVVRGIAGHLANIKATLKALGTRAGEDEHPPTWRAPALRFDEMDDIRLLVDLHAHQLSHVSYGEYQTAYRLAVARVRQGKGEVVNEEGLAA